jgi:hypothetical protein
LHETSITQSLPQKTFQTEKGEVEEEEDKEVYQRHLCLMSHVSSSGRVDNKVEFSL